MEELRHHTELHRLDTRPRTGGERTVTAQQQLLNNVDSGREQRVVVQSNFGVKFLLMLPLVILRDGTINDINQLRQASVVVLIELLRAVTLQQTREQR